jgi:hypothetical protein
MHTCKLLQLQQQPRLLHFTNWPPIKRQVLQLLRQTLLQQ